MAAVGHTVSQQGNPGRGAKWRHFSFFLSLLTDGLLVMVEEEGRHQQLGHCFRKSRITGYLEGGLKTSPEYPSYGAEDAEGQRYQCFIYNLYILSLFIYIDQHIPYKCQ